jgi:hypothetical protein
MAIWMTWDQVLLIPLGDEKLHVLKEIYADIEIGLKGGYINPELFSVNPQYGIRPRYTHAVRAGMKSLQKRGLVQHVGQGRTGVYKITESGSKYLLGIEP